MRTARIIYLNQAISVLLGLPTDQVDGQPLNRFLPELDWDKFSAMDNQGGQRVMRHEFEISFPRQRFLRLYAAPLDGEAPAARGWR